MTQAQTESIRFECTPAEKELARQIGIRTGRSGYSATMRRLIIEEAERMNIDIFTSAPAGAGRKRGIGDFPHSPAVSDDAAH